MTQPSRLHLFQAFGIELEYMLVDKTALTVKPITDELLKHELGEYASDFENGLVTWSNELVLHVISMHSKMLLPTMSKRSILFLINGMRCLCPQLRIR